MLELLTKLCTTRDLFELKISNTHSVVASTTVDPLTVVLATTVKK